MVESQPGASNRRGQRPGLSAGDADRPPVPNLSKELEEATSVTATTLRRQMMTR